MKVDTLQSDAILNVEGAVARLAGDRDLFADMLGFYFDDSPKLVADLKSAAERGDASQLRMASHALRGLVASCGGERAARAAKRVEDAADTGALENVDSLVAALLAELESLKREALAYRR